MSTAATSFIYQAIADFGQRDPRGLRVVDFGCGRGGLVDTLLAEGVDMYGCDLDPYWEGHHPRLLQIQRAPYRLPFDDATVDVVISTGVLEHARNVDEIFRELARVLKPGGMAMHIYPAKWYLPTEPHISVPFVSAMWPHVPRWWLALWARLGLRGPTQTNMPWRQVLDNNIKFCAGGICYFPESVYREAASREFQSLEFPMDYFLRVGGGGAAKLYRRLPLKFLWAWLFRHTRSAFMVTRKGGVSDPPTAGLATP